MEEFLAFARHQFELSQPQDDGTPLLAHLQTASRTMGKLHPMLADAPALPLGCLSLWEHFLELHNSRGSTGWGAARITFRDMVDWQQMRKTQLNQWEIDCIRKADDAWLSDFAPKPKKDAQ